MASFIYNQFKTSVLSKLISCTTGGDIFKCALYTVQLAQTAVSYATTSEVAGVSGYAQSGTTITNNGLTGASTVSFLCASATWTATGTGFSAAYCTIYASTGSGAIQNICSFDFGGTQTASGGGTFTISFNNTSPRAVFYIA